MASNQILIQGLIELHLKGEGGQQAVASMSKIIAQAKEVEKATGGMGTGAKKSAEGVDLLDKAFGKLGRTVAGYFAVGAITNFLKDSYLGFARTERQALATENQIRSLGQAAQGEGFRDFISQLSTTSGILDDDLVPAMQRALGAFRDYATAQEIVTLASKFAAAGIGDVGSNVDAMARFFQTGSARALTQFGINVKGGAEATLALTEGIKGLREQAERLGGGFQDAQSQINSMALVMDNLKDSMGKSLSVVGEQILVAGRYWNEFIENVTAGMNRAEGQAQDILNRSIKPKPSDVYGPVDTRTAAEVKFATEQKARDDRDNADKIAKAKEAEEKIIADRLALNEKSQQQLLQSRAAFYEEGSAERVALELELNSRLEAAAIASAKKIGADTLAIAAFYANERGKINASKGETKSEKAKRDELAEFDPRAGFELVEAAYLEHEATLTKIALDEAAKRDEAAQLSAKWSVEQKQLETLTALNSAATIAGVLSTTFAKHKAFAIAMAIVNTALGITEVWKDPSIPTWYAKLAATLVVAASGAAQIAAIRGANLGSGGGTSASVASAPTRAATPPPGTQIGAQTAAEQAAMSGRGFAAGGTTIINIEHAFGDQQSMTKLTREINRVNANNQGNLR